MSGMKPKRVLIFSFAYYPRFVGGAEVAVKEITDRIPPSEIAFDLVALRLDSRLPATEKMGNVTVHRVGWSVRREFSADSLPWYLHANKYLYLFTAVRKALQLDRDNHYDAIWSLMAAYSSFAAVIFKLIRPSVPFLFTLQDGDPIPYIKRRAMPLYPLFRMMFTKADHITAISNYLADWARAMGAKCPVEVIPNAVDYDLFSKPVPAVELQALKERLGKKPGDIFLVTTSRLVVKNAVGDVIKALKYLPESVKFLVIGRGYLEQELKDLAASLGLNDGAPFRTGGTASESGGAEDSRRNRVIFTGFVPHADMPKYLQASDVFVRPSLSEGLGNSFLEAMAAGLPVIGTSVGGIPDFLKDGETGLVCESGNPQSIAQKVEKLIRDRESRDYMVRNARALVSGKYRWESVAGEMKKIMLSLTMK